MPKRTIVQLESFYPQVIQDVYKSIPGLQALSFHQQIEQLLATGFSGGHNVAPYLDAARWSAHYIVLNSPASQARWAEERGLLRGATARDILVAQLRYLDPDILYLSDIPGFDFSILAELRRRPHVVGWHATTVSDRTPWQAFDLVLSGIQRIREEVVQRGAKAAACYMPAAPPFSHQGGHHVPAQGVVFSGSFYGGIHDQRALQFRKLSRAIAGVGLDIHTSQAFGLEEGDAIRFHPPVFGRDVLGLYARHPIVLDSRGNFNLADDSGPRETSNMRVFEATRAGSLLLTEHSPNLADYFDIGEEIETYRDFEELVAKIRFYSAPENEDVRRKIAAAGLARTRREHLLEHRAAWMERILLEHFGRSSVRGAGVASAPILSQSDAREAVVLVASASSQVFALAQAEQLAQHQPGADVYVVCADHETEQGLGQRGVSWSLIGLESLAKWGVHRDMLSTLGDDLTAVFHATRRLFEHQPALERVSWVGGDLVVRARPPAHDPNALVLGSLELGGQLDHAVESFGVVSAHFVSLSRGVLARLWADVEKAAGLNVEKLGSLAAANGVSVVAVPVETPWSRPDAEAGPALALLGPLAYVANSEWQFLPLESAKDWQSYLGRVYVPQLQHLQGLYRRDPSLARQGDQMVRAASLKWVDYLRRHEFRHKAGYRMLSRAEYRAFANETSGWDTPSVAAIQHASFRHLLDEFKAGRARADMLAMVHIFRRIADQGTSVLEVGCGSGYNNELIRMAAGPAVRYSGIDIAHSMVDLAQQIYPEDQFKVMTSEDLRFADGSFGVVLNGASLMHTIDYEKALSEARRVASRYVVLHTVTVAETDQNLHFEKNAYGSRVQEVCFSSRALNAMLDAHRLMPVQLEDSISYDLSQVTGVETRSVSIACFCLPPAPPQPNHYCTYFDANYLPRAVLMIRSLKRHDPTAVVYALCFDATSYGAMKALGMEGVHPVALEELLQADPEFARARENRTQIEWYFTATSCWVTFLIQRLPGVSRLIYLDADLYFYASPEFLIDEAKNASVQIIEHRFSPHLANLVLFGRFNVGWVGFTTSEEGRRVISDYRRNCLEWCYDRLEGDRFGDQKYLDRWPEHYANCCVSSIKGANVAWWNLDHAQPRLFGDRVYVGVDQLVFFHFQEIKRLNDGTYTMKKDPAGYGAYYEMVYVPYMAELANVDAEVRPLLDDFRIVDIRYQSW